MHHLTDWPSLCPLVGNDSTEVFVSYRERQMCGGAGVKGPSLAFMMLAALVGFFLGVAGLSALVGAITCALVSR